MKYTTVNDLRSMFLDFFASKNHQILPSASLVPHGDPTLLLTGAGMVPFKPYFLGQEKSEYPRVTSCQRCLRTPDIDNVGKTDRHGTFFEMLGNFSFGDYFKEEIIPWAWEFITKHLELPVDKLWVSVYLDDDEAFSIWEQKVGVPQERIVRLGKADNFWEIGVGPCGPCSEIYIDRGLEYGCADPNCKPGCECERFLEFWNLVFIQFQQDEQGNLKPLIHKGIDTGMGMERVASLLQGTKSIFEIDNMRAIMDRVATLARTTYGSSAAHDVSLRVVTDHVRSVTFLVCDGVFPANEGRGYVLRRLLRRAVRHGRLLGIQQEFLLDIVDVVIENMSLGYPELVEKREYIHKVVSLEEKRFHETLDQGMLLLQDLMTKAQANGVREITGSDAFKLYDTFGFPVELTQEIAEEKGFALDEAGFLEAMQAQRQRARSARAEMGYLGTQVDLYKELRELMQVEFVGYEQTETIARVVAVIKDDQRVDSLEQGDAAVIVMDVSPFYPEGGGQIADTGTITAKAGQFSVKDVRKPVEGLITHQGTITSGRLEVGDQVLASVYQKERVDTARHHSVTHLLQKVLREVLGSHVNQSGSYVSPHRLRFDFTHFESVKKAELALIEQKVNEAIMQNDPVSASVMSIEEARAEGAMALFGEKYGKTVRVICMGESKELCGGTHVSATGDIGLFRIISEGSVAAGIRRIEAVAGKQALQFTDEREKLLQEVSLKLQSKPDSVLDQVTKLISQQKACEQAIEKLKRDVSGDLADTLVANAQVVGEVRLVVTEVELTDTGQLRSLGDNLRDRLNPGVVFLGARSDDKVLLLSMVSKEIAGKQVHAGNVIKVAAQICGGGGGGRPDMAQAGGRNPEMLDEALKKAEEIFLEQLKGK